MTENEKHLAILVEDLKEEVEDLKEEVGDWKEQTGLALDYGSLLEFKIAQLQKEEKKQETCCGEGSEEGSQPRGHDWPDIGKNLR